MLLQIIALILAFSIRKVKVKGLDDAKYVGAAIYVTSIVLAVIIVATYTLKDVINGFAGLFCTGFLVGNTVILILVFVPLVSRYLRISHIHVVTVYSSKFLRSKTSVIQPAQLLTFMTPIAIDIPTGLKIFIDKIFVIHLLHLTKIIHLENLEL